MVKRTGSFNHITKTAMNAVNYNMQLSRLYGRVMNEQDREFVLWFNDFCYSSRYEKSLSESPIGAKATDALQEVAGTTNPDRGIFYDWGSSWPVSPSVQHIAKLVGPKKVFNYRAQFSLLCRSYYEKGSETGTEAGPG